MKLPAAGPAVPPRSDAQKLAAHQAQEQLHRCSLAFIAGIRCRERRAELALLEAAEAKAMLADLVRAEAAARRLIQKLQPIAGAVK